MKKNQCGVIFLVACSAGFAHAQSSVKVWGRVGGGVEVLNNIGDPATGTSKRRIAEGSQWGTSILGFDGREDLGGGAAVLFSLESAIAADTGAFGGGKPFQRAAWIAYKSDWGMVRLGQGNFINNYIWSFDPFLLEDYSASTFTSYRNGSKLANGIRYESPSWNGFEFAGQLNLGESPDGFKRGPADSVVGNGTAYGFSGAYKNGNFEIRGIYDRIYSKDGKLDQLFGNGSQEVFLGAKYKWDNTTLQSGVARYTAPDSAQNISRAATHAWVGVQHRPSFAPNLNLQAAIYRMKVGAGEWTKDHAGEGTGTMLSLGAMYNLSKRTFLYTNLSHVRNSSFANFSVRPTGPGYGDPITGNGTSPLAGRSQTGMFAGMMHNF
ncbi:porin [Comamonas sp. JUb58]|uniref:porin n=1 Tax=Comamonas sp. JUb58 TaxID=2485114 RepID=UPI0010CFC447|nr:porin [Comamonas sp. JUb58]TDS70420.1 putative porin [Comamonas sp. JUb58]